MEFWIIILERVEFVKLLNLNGYMIDNSRVGHYGRVILFNT